MNNDEKTNTQCHITPVKVHHNGGLVEFEKPCGIIYKLKHQVFCDKMRDGTCEYLATIEEKSNYLRLVGLEKSETSIA